MGEATEVGVSEPCSSVSAPLDSGFDTSSSWSKTSDMLALRRNLSNSCVSLACNLSCTFSRSSPSTLFSSNGFCFLSEASISRISFKMDSSILFATVNPSLCTSILEREMVVLR